MTMLERMAKAWWEAREQTMPERTRMKWEAGTPLARELLLGQCRAALLAIREPSEAVRDAAIDADLDIYWSYRADGRPGGPEDVFTVLIDAILREAAVSDDTQPGTSAASAP
jgi:hypothetical protein